MSGRAEHASASPLAPWQVAGGATAGALVYATHLFLFHRLNGDAASFPREFAEAAVHFGAWAVLVPVVLRVARRWPLLDGRLLAPLLLHLAIALVVALAQLGLHTWLDRVLIHGWTGFATFLDEGRRFFARTYYANVVVYFVIVVADGSLAWARRRRAREAELETHLAVAQLDALRQQLQPHFLFNALNAVSTLVADDPSAAQRMIARLADLLRQALDPRNAGEVPLWRELELAASYLSVEQVRFGDRLVVEVDVPASARQALVPGLLLQPLLENAVRHGVALRPGPARITIAACVEGGMLQLQVTDRGRATGREPAPATPPPHAAGGIGLGNVRARLHHLYGDAQHLTLAPTADGTTVDIELPLRLAAVVGSDVASLAGSSR